VAQQQHNVRLSAIAPAAAFYMPSCGDRVAAKMAHACNTGNMLLKMQPATHHLGLLHSSHAMHL
jgi:hypothetical protein